MPLISCKNKIPSSNSHNLTQSFCCPPVVALELENMKNASDFVLVNQEDVYSCNDKDKYFASIPKGYKFKPDDEELIIHYLAKKISNQPLPLNNFYDVDFYTKSPATLTAEYKCNGDKEWYFFSKRNRKYPRGERPNRSAGSGYWKATGADKSIIFNETEIGSKKALVFFEGKAPEGIKTEWIMYEYTLHNAPKRKRIDMKLDEWVLYKVYKNLRKDRKEKHKINEQSLAQPETTNELKKQTVMITVSDQPEPSQPELFWKQEQTVMPNHMNQMDYSGSLYYDQGFHNLYGTGKEIHYQSQQQPIVPIENWFQHQQITTDDMLQSNVNSGVDYQAYGNQHRNDPQPVKNGYDFQDPSSYWDFTSDCDNINDFNVDQFFDFDENNFNQQQSSSVPN